MNRRYDVRIESWEHLSEQLFFKSWNPVIRRHRSDYIFRGVSSKAYDLQTSLQRHLVDTERLQHLGFGPERLERAILRNFRKYAHRDASPGNFIWNWLSVAQHHGLPTRLLDWTFSPYVAAFFTCDHVDKFGVDGSIWCVDTNVVRAALPTDWRDALSEQYAWLFDVRMLDRLAPDLTALDASFSQAPLLTFFEPPSLDDRIVNQSGMFSVMSSPVARVDTWLAQHPGSYRRLVIPSPLKPEIRDKLDMMNLTERVIYPGLDGLAQWLKRHYSPAAVIKADRPTRPPARGRVKSREP